MAENEIKIITSLNHPNILKCYEVLRTGELYYIVTEYCPDGNLKTYLEKRGKI